MANAQKQQAPDTGRPRFGRRWWLAGLSPRGEHHAMLDAAGRWPGAMVGLRAGAFIATPPEAAPAGWMAGNTPLTGNYMPVSIRFVQNKAEITQRHLPNIGPTDTTVASGIAMQQALAASLRGASGNGGK